jgi:hypothetical protein
MHPVVCVQYRLHNNDIYRMETKINTNVTTFVYYSQMLRYMFRPFLGHKNTVTCRPVAGQQLDKHFPA